MKKILTALMLCLVSITFYSCSNAATDSVSENDLKNGLSLTGRTYGFIERSSSSGTVTAPHYIIQFITDSEGYFSENTDRSCNDFVKFTYTFNYPNLTINFAEPIGLFYTKVTTFYGQVCGNTSILLYGECEIHEKTEGYVFVAL